MSDPTLSLIPGRASEAGTQGFATRHDALKKAGAYREWRGLCVSTVGMGTYLGEATAEDRAAYRGAAKTALSLGVNVFDTAINYRHQASERDIGAALGAAFDAGTASREEVFVSTKGGFLPFDCDDNEGDPRAYLAKVYLKSELCPPDEIVAGCQCLAPAYLTDQIARSRRNLGLETLDLYYLHNPEMQLGEVRRPEFLRRIRGAFEALARARADGHIGIYGVATWDGLRQVPDASDGRLLLEDLRRAAIEVEGSQHGFRAIQLPLNLGMTEALCVEHDPRNHPGRTVLEVAEALGLMVMTSASLLQGRLASGLPAQFARLFPGCETDAERALQHTRSAPGVTTALVGMKTEAHVRENAGLLAKPRMRPEIIAKLYAGARG
ncbi:MAG: aldo/keto reductase [Sumerlaeia bacterium]